MIIDGDICNVCPEKGTNIFVEVLVTGSSGLLSNSDMTMNTIGYATDIRYLSVLIHVLEMGSLLT